VTGNQAGEALVAMITGSKKVYAFAEPYTRAWAVCQFKDRAASGRLPDAVGSLMGSARGGGSVEIAGTISAPAS
jgi:hypothetical protein